jgi:hypothetical protein
LICSTAWSPISIGFPAGICPAKFSSLTNFQQSHLTLIAKIVGHHVTDWKEISMHNPHTARAAVAIALALAVGTAFAAARAEAVQQQRLAVETVATSLD